MAGNLKEKQGTTTAAVTSGSSITNGASSAAPAANIANSTNLDSSVTARLHAACGSTPVQGTTTALYLVPKSDGSAVAGLDTVTPFFSQNYYAGNFVWPAASSATAQDMDIDGIPLSAIDYAAYIVNGFGQTISSTWTLNFYGTTGQYT